MGSLDPDCRFEDEPTGAHGSPEADLLRAGDAEAIATWVWLGELASGKAGAAIRFGSPVTLDPPRTIGRFRLDALIGLGGYAAVFQAVDNDLECAVALKLAWPSVMFDATAAQRFVDEAKTAAGLVHPGIVRVYAAGCIGAVGYIALELVDGPSLGDWLRDQERVPIRVAAEIVREIAGAIAIAHDRGIIHRDLKPNNVLLRPLASTETLPFQVVVCDFGLARRPRTAAALGVTRTHEIIGTDPYIAPEQLAGDKTEPTPACDVFSLGVILYELVTGRRPFEGESADEIRDLIRHGDPPAVRSLRSRVPADLETILGKCLEKSPKRRYASGQELADDLGRFLNHEPIRARRPTLARRATKFARRRPWIVSILALAALVVAMAGALATNRVSASREIAVARASAATSEGIQRQHLYAANLRQAASAARHGNRREVIDLLEECQQLAHEPVRCGIEWDVLWSQSHDFDVNIKAHQGHVHTVSFSPNGEVLASGGEDGQVVLWRTATWERLHGWKETPDEVNAVEISADGSLVAVGCNDGRLVVRRLNDQSVVFDEKVFEGRVFTLTWLGDALQLAVGGEGALIAIVDPINGTQRRTKPLALPGDNVSSAVDFVREVSDLRFIGGQAAVAAAATPHTYFLIDSSTLDTVRSWRQLKGADTIAAAMADASYLAMSINYDANPAIGDEALIVKASDGEGVARLVVPHDVEQLRFSQDAQVLVGAFRNGSIWTWEMEDVRAHLDPKGRCWLAHDGRATTVTMSRDSKWLVSGGWDGHISGWHGRKWGYYVDAALDARPAVAQFSPCGRWFAVAYGPDSTHKDVWRFALFDARTGELLWQRRVTWAPVVWPPMIFSPSGDEVVFPDDAGTLCGHDPMSGRIELVYHLPADDIFDDVRFSPDGALLLLQRMPRRQSESNDRQRQTESHDVAYFDRAADRIVRSEALPGLHSFGCARTVLGDLWVQIMADRKIRLSATPSAEPILTLAGPHEHASAAAISPDGRHLAIATESGTIYAWDLEKPADFKKFVGHESQVHQLRFSPDSRTIISLGLDGTLWFWSVATGEHLLQLGTPEERISSIALQPDGKVAVLTIERAAKFGFQIHRLGPDRDLLPKTFDLRGIGQ